MNKRAGIQKWRFLAFSLSSGKQSLQTVAYLWSKHMQSLILLLLLSGNVPRHPFFMHRMRTSQVNNSSTCSPPFSSKALSSRSSTNCCPSSSSYICSISTSVPPVYSFLADSRLFISSLSEKPPAAETVWILFSSSSSSSAISRLSLKRL